MATDNYREFSLNWEALAEKAKHSVSDVMRKVTLDLWTGITQRTPVDTGRARANWFVNVGSPSKQLDLYPEFKTNFRTVAGKRVRISNNVIPAPQVPDLSKIDGTQDVFISNNLPYIKRLDEGWSQQAPSGMIEGAITAVKARAENFLKT